MKLNLVPVGIGVLLFVASCGQNENKVSRDTATTSEIEVSSNEIYISDSTANKNEQQQGNPPIVKQAVTNVDWDKKIIKTATLNIQVNDYQKYYTLLRQTVVKAGGYVAAENQTGSEFRIENVVTIKVPVALFDESMNLLSSGTGKEKVLERTVSSQDVTGEVVDTKSRIEARRQVRLRYLELLKGAKTMEDILKVQREINEIQEQIEMGTGRVNYLNHSAAYSTIQLTFFQILNPSGELPADPTFFTKLWLAFEKGWEFIKNIIIGLITIWPLLLAGLVTAFLLRKYRTTLRPRP